MKKCISLDRNHVRKKILIYLNWGRVEEKPSIMEFIYHVGVSHYKLNITQGIYKMYLK